MEKEVSVKVEKAQNGYILSTDRGYKRIAASMEDVTIELATSFANQIQKGDDDILLTLKVEKIKKEVNNNQSKQD